jgi:DNA-binding response OmpR family regulator
MMTGNPEAWREILRACKLLPAPPCVIVTSRLADDRLWMELLNEGAFDLLAKPFDPSDVMRIIHSAWVHWQNRYGLADGRRSHRDARPRRRYRLNPIPTSNWLRGERVESWLNVIPFQRV